MAKALSKHASVLGSLGGRPKATQNRQAYFDQDKSLMVTPDMSKQKRQALQTRISKVRYGKA